MKKIIISILIFISATTSVAIAQLQTDLSFGTVEIPKGVIIVVINSDNEHITIKPKEKVSQLPVGRYRIDYWIMERKDKDGNIWKLKGSNLGSRGIFYVTKGQEIKLSLGEPIISSPTASREYSTYYFSHHLIRTTIRNYRNHEKRKSPRCT